MSLQHNNSSQVNFFGIVAQEHQLMAACLGLYLQFLTL